MGLGSRFGQPPRRCSASIMARSIPPCIGWSVRAGFRRVGNSRRTSSAPSTTASPPRAGASLRSNARGGAVCPRRSRACSEPTSGEDEANLRISATERSESMILRDRVRALVRLLFFPARADRELDDELRFHLTEETRERVERGESEADASAAARRALGNVARVKEETRAVWVSTRLEQFLQDLRFGFRILTKSPAVSATAVVLIALVIGGNTTVFSIAHGILRKPTPGVHADDLAVVSWVNADGNPQAHNSYRAYLYFLEHSATIRPLAAIDFQRLTLTHENGSFAVKATVVSP